MDVSLSHHIQSAFNVSPDETARILAFFKPLDLKKNEYFLKADQFSHYLGFIQSGLLREYLCYDGREVTKWISGPGYFAVDLASFLFGKTARVSMQALTDCQMFVLSKTDYGKIAQVVPKWPEIEKMFIARCFTVLEDRVVSHLSMSAEERYHAFFQYNPDLFNQVPLQYLASMLGMTPETFSRIRKKRSQRSS
jgi:CRP/FNR family transcriptional regulator, anaerobic regulatory protein